MVRKKKNIRFIIGLFLLVLLLAACGGNNESSQQMNEEDSIAPGEQEELASEKLFKML